MVFAKVQAGLDGGVTADGGDAETMVHDLGPESSSIRSTPS